MPSDIKVGIDFGTTYSGVAWIHTSKPDKTSVVQLWPQGKGRRNSDKVPTVIAYDPKFTPDGYVWGFDAQRKPNKIEWVKLLLDPSQEKRYPELFESLRRNRANIPAGKMPVDVVADYLSALERHFRATLDRTYGEGVRDAASVEYTLTVPAVWSDAAKALTLEAADKAGLGSSGKLTLLAEPEAAAIYTLSAIQPNHLKVGNTFVIADCGGGTVDLIAYKITQLEPRLQVVECATGGGLCGSSFINRRFEHWVKKRVGIQYRLMSDDGRRLLLNEFDEIKKAFSDENGDDEYSLPASGLEDDESAGVDSGLMKVTNGDVKSIIDPTVDEAVQLVQSQVREAESTNAGARVSAILLVGGFGESEYLREKLEQGVKSGNGDNIPVLNPVNSWTAVVRGAVLRNLEGSESVVSTRLVRRHYGVSYSTRFIKGHHPKTDKYWCKLNQANYCRGRAQWCIRKGTSISEDNEIRVPFVWQQPLNHSWSSMVETLYACNDAEAPPSVNDPGVFPVCVLPCDLSGVPRHLFQQKTNSSKMKYLNLQFEVVMCIKPAGLEFSVEVDGVKYGSITPEFIP